jgi:hypothetical protein
MMTADPNNFASNNCRSHLEMHHFGACSVTVTERVARKLAKMVKLAANFGKLVEFDGKCPIYCF